MRDQTFMNLMRLLPKSALSSAVGIATRAPAPSKLHQAAIRAFVRRYRVNVDESERSIVEYPTFAEFFTRKLKAGARVIDMSPNVVACPCDGAISELGTIEGGRCLQAKGLSFPVDKLLGAARSAMDFEGGQFITIYLSPRDYHRFHSPVAGTVTGYTYLPGEFWPVNQASVRLKDALFSLNERLVTWLQSPAFGKVAYVAVGATCVSRIHAAYDDIVTHTGGKATSRLYEKAIPIEKGAEIGMFEMGSTVIALFEKGRLKFDPKLKAGVSVRLGERLGVSP